MCRPVAASRCARVGETMGHRGMAVVMVEDNGPGIAPARREEVFKRFFRGDRHARRLAVQQAAPSGRRPGAGHRARDRHAAPGHHPHRGCAGHSTAPAPAPSALSAVVAVHGDHADSDERRDPSGSEPAPRRASMRFVIRIPCEAPGTARVERPGRGEAGLLLCSRSFGASMVPRQFGLPQRHSYSFFSFLVYARLSPAHSHRTALRLGRYRAARG